MNLRKIRVQSLQSSEVRKSYKGNKMKKSNKTKKKYFSPFTLCASIACAVLAVFVLNGYISLNELTLQGSKKKKELDAVTSENAVRAVQIDRKNSLGNIEEIAVKQLGMVKLESYQIQKVNLVSDDSVEVIAPEEKEDFLDGVVASFNILVEYLN